MSCGCGASGGSSHSCATKSITGCSSVDTCGNSYKLSVFDWLSGVQNPISNEEGWVEVRFKNDRKSFFKNTNNLSLSVGFIVAVESNPGYDIGVVSLVGELVKIQMKRKNESGENCSKIYRIATQKDIDIWSQSRKKELSVKVEARKIAQNLGLQMKISDVEYQGDGAKITFYYTSDGRVDFRQLIKEYAMLFRVKIDMKQIGFRQEASKVGGIGSCGRELCCSTWLTDFRSVNTNAARYQQLSINPQKLAGQCGKLKCCLNFELDSYMDALGDFPSTSTILETEKGKASCIKIDVFKKRMWFAYVENSMIWYDLSIAEVKEMIDKNRRGEKIMPLEDYKAELDVNVKPIDLIQENKVDRFEKNKKPRKNNRKGNQPKKLEVKKEKNLAKPQENRSGETSANKPHHKGGKNRKHDKK